MKERGILLPIFSLPSKYGVGDFGNEAYEFIDILSEIEENNECYIIKNLKVNGRDIMSLGYKNKEVGEVLNYLLEIVIEDYTLNKKDVLIKKIKEIL